MDDRLHLRKPVKLQPSEKASLVSKLFFCWAPPLFYRSYNKIIEEDYYQPLKNHKSDYLGNELEKSWKNEFLRNTEPSLWNAIWKTFRLEFLALGILFIFTEFTLKLTQPWLIGKLLNQYDNSTTTPKEETYFYGSLILVSNFLSVTINHFYQLKIQHLGMKIRIACCTTIYRKALRINKKIVTEWNVGKIVNLLSNDVNRFDLAPMHMLQLIVAPAETIFVIYCLYATGGPTTIGGIVFLILFVPLQMYMGKLTTLYRQKTATRTDRRIKLMDEIISGIQVIKTFTWEKLFIKMVAETRKLEIKQILKMSYIRALNISFMLFMNRTGILLCILAHVLVEKEINAKYVFVISSLYAILRQALTVYLPFGIHNFSETRVSVERIRNFLMVKEVLSKKIVTTYIPSDTKESQMIKSDCISYQDEDESRTVGVHLENVSVKRISSISDHLLSDINFEVRSNELVVITGPVGSGKSSLLYTILNELPLCRGKLNVEGAISYTPQEPWLFSGSIRQNILFGSVFDLDKYKKIIGMCQLNKDFETLPDGDCTSVGESGTALSGGQKSRISLARAVYKDADIYLLDDPLASVDAKVGKRIFQECILRHLKNKCTILVTHNKMYLTGAIDKVYIMDNGTITRDVTYEKTDFEDDCDDYNETGIEEFRKPNIERMEERNHGTVSKQVYGLYAKAGGHDCKQIFLFLLFICAQGAASGADYFVAFWVNLTQDQKMNHFNNIVCISIYSTIIFAIMFFSIVRSIIFFKYCMMASINLHSYMFAAVIKAAMVFFKTTPVGRILNRFSKDVGIIDETLPSILMETCQIAFIVLGSILLIVFLNPWMMLPTIGIFILFYFFKTRFLWRSRNLKRFEAAARSPIYSHMHTSMQGLTSIRTYNAQNTLQNEFDYYQDLHSSAFYMFMTCNRAFGFWLDMTCVFYTAAAIIAVLLIETPAGNVGLSVTQSINLIGVLQWGIRQWSELENQMISVERVVEYTKILPEEKTGIPLTQFPQNWPTNGQIKFESVSLQYYANNRLALDNITFLINPGEKIGIVGRTGAGKSSLISALFRLFQTEGKILVDDIDIAHIPLHILRSKMSIIPQEPILFTGSLRDNLDPHHEQNDSTLWKVIEQVELKSTIQNLPHDLSYEITDADSTFSVGQKQLICLARAILGNNKILILDEATANIDSQTDLSIQQTIKKTFRNCTILTVAHRLDTVIESDKVLVMDNGNVMEFDRPTWLLQNPESHFSQLVKQNSKG